MARVPDRAHQHVWTLGVIAAGAWTTAQPPGGPPPWPGGVGGVHCPGWGLIVGEDVWRVIVGPPRNAVGVEMEDRSRYVLVAGAHGA
jgi:hypothetical protein